ncbi:MAG: RNA helicase, partial [Limnobacter sp.]|nr:RNA helicase [Limnobacter sp.]
PMKAEDYVHRIGRTGRAGRSGVAITLAGYDDRPKIKAIEKFISAAIPVGVVEGLEPRPMPERSSDKPGNRRRKNGSKPHGEANFEGKRSWGKPETNRTRSRPAQEVKPASERRRSDSAKPSFSPKAPSRKPVRSSGFNTDRGRGSFVRKRG